MNLKSSFCSKNLKIQLEKKNLPSAATITIAPRLEADLSMTPSASLSKSLSQEALSQHWHWMWKSPLDITSFECIISILTPNPVDGAGLHPRTVQNCWKEGFFLFFFTCVLLSLRISVAFLTLWVLRILFSELPAIQGSVQSTGTRDKGIDCPKDSLLVCDADRRNKAEL